jgi:hypothetical protein
MARWNIEIMPITISGDMALMPYPLKYDPIYDITKSGCSRKIPEFWSKDEQDGLKIIYYSFDIPLYESIYTSFANFEESIMKEVRKELRRWHRLDWVEESLKLRIHSIHWEDDDCSLYVEVYVGCLESLKQKKFRAESGH